VPDPLGELVLALREPLGNGRTLGRWFSWWSRSRRRLLLKPAQQATHHRVGPWLARAGGNPCLKQHPTDLLEAHSVTAGQKLPVQIGLLNRGFTKLAVSPRGCRPQTTDRLAALLRGTDSLTRDQSPGSGIQKDYLNRRLVPSLVPVQDSDKNSLNETH
jgi:hypothetical protein